MHIGRTGAVAIALALGFQLAFVSANMHGPLLHRQESVQQQLALWSGAPLTFDGMPSSYPQARNRILFPAILTAVSRLFPVLRPGQWYLVLRVVFAMAMQVGVLWCLTTLTNDLSIALVGVVLLSYCLLFTFTHPWEHAWDFGDAFFPFLFVLLTVGPRWASLQNRLWLLAVALLATLNRESAAFAGIIWLFVHGRRRGQTLDALEAMFGITVSAASYGLATAVRHWTAPNEMHGDQIFSSSPIAFLSQQAHRVMSAVTDRSLFEWPVLYVCALTPFVVILVRNRRFLNATLTGLLLAAATVAGISLVFANIHELRAFIPVFSLLVCVCALAQGNAARARASMAAEDGAIAS